MKTIVLDGSLVAQKWLAEIMLQVKEFENKYQRKIQLGVIQVGDIKASNLYIKNKIKQAEKLGIEIKLIKLLDFSNTEKIINLIENEQTKFDGILLQLPLPDYCDEKTIINKIDPERDVDGFSAYRNNWIWSEKNFNPLNQVIACTPKGIIKLLTAYQIPIAEKHVVIINRSNIVGKPLAAALLAMNATVTICHSKTANLKQHCLAADIIITGVGIPNFINADYVKPETVVIDVSINWTKDGILTGDVVKNSLDGHCAAYSPVPKGIGPMTVAAIFSNLIILAKNHAKNAELIKLKE